MRFDRLALAGPPGRLAIGGGRRHRWRMDLDALLLHYFGTTDLDTLDPALLDAGREKVAIAFGTESDAGRRFALWLLLDVLGAAPDPAAAFEDPANRKAAEDYLWAARRLAER